MILSDLVKVASVPIGIRMIVDSYIGLICPPYVSKICSVYGMVSDKQHENYY